MEKIFHWANSFKTLGEADDGGLDIKGSASTNAMDRAGDVIEPGAWTKGGLDNYKQNPILLFNHNYDRPIGRAKELNVSENGLDITARISKSAGEIKDLIKDGVLGAFSVGFKVKDADYISETDGYKIKDAELFEVSVVSVPCNQNAVFSVSKSFDTMEEYNKFKKDFIKTNSTEEMTEVEQSSEARADKTETKMSEEKQTPEISPEFDLDAFAKEAAEKAVASYAMKQAELKAAEEKADVEAAEQAAEAEAVQKAADEAKQTEQKTIVRAVTSGAETLVRDIETRVNEKQEDLGQVVRELQAELKERSEDIMNMRESKRIFENRRGVSDWKTAFADDVVDAKVLGLATGRGYDTDLAKSTMEKVNAHSGVGVSSADFEQIVSTNVERDIQNELVLAPLFREIPMSAANMIIPILPDSGYAEFTGNQTATGSSPHGNLAQTGDTYGSPYGGVDLAEKTLTTKKLISQSYLGNETEEDAIMPILPLIRESIVRSHAKGIENALLLGNHSTGVYTSGTFDGLVTMAAADSDQTQSTTAVATDTVTAAELLSLRKNMGKYGVNPNDVVYIVSQAVYFQLLEDAEFQDANLVGDMATKLNGEIGQVFGSKILLCDEFPAQAANGFGAIAVYPRNYVMPRLRGVTLESDYEVANQRRVLVASQRIGFDDLIAGATSKWAYKYKAS
jgi:HK97 family phage prohead protease/HK97 family phage major capsid protein